MGKNSRVWTRTRTEAKLVPVLFQRPFPDDWKLPDTSPNRRCEREPSRNIDQKKADPVLSVFRAVLSLSLSARVYSFLVCLKMTSAIGLTTLLGVFEKKNSVDCEPGSPLSC